MSSESNLDHFVEDDNNPLRLMDKKYELVEPELSLDKQAENTAHALVQMDDDDPNKEPAFKHFMEQIQKHKIMLPMNYWFTFSKDTIIGPVIENNYPVLREVIENDPKYKDQR